jgi:alanyl aminopeptidase
MMSEMQQTLQLAGTECPRWVFPNAGGSGYYRWTLDAATRAALIEDFGQLTPVEALSAVDSAFAAFEAGKLDAASLLSIVVASSGGRSRQVITAPLPYLQKYVRQYFSITDKQNFLEFARELYQPIIEQTANSTDADQQLLYAQLISFMALTALDPEARNQMLQMAQSFVGAEGVRDADAMPSDLYEPSVTVAIQDSDASYLHRLIRFRKELDDPLFESASANAIGHVRNPDLLGAVHELALSAELGPSETFGIISAALAEPALRDQHWSWLRENIPAVIDKIPAQWRRSLPGMAGVFCDQKKLDELSALFDEHGDLTPGYQRSLNQTVEQIQLCIALQNQGKKLANAMSAL